MQPQPTAVSIHADAYRQQRLADADRTRTKVPRGRMRAAERPSHHQTEVRPMSAYESANVSAADVQMRHMLNIAHLCGPLTAQMLAAEERHQAAREWAAGQAAIQGDRQQVPGAARLRLGTILVRMGNRLQGAVPTASVETSPAVK